MQPRSDRIFDFFQFFQSLKLANFELSALNYQAMKLSHTQTDLKAALNAFNN